MTLLPKADFMRLFADAGLSVSDAQYEKFALYADMLAQKNAVMNLTAITEPAEVAEKHFLDSCLPLTMADIPKGASVVDVGSGAGFPGVPAAILRNDIRLTLIDSLNKRVGFLRELTNALGIEASCQHIRAEDAGRGELRGVFDVATARAVSRLSVLSEYCLPLLKTGGIFLALKGSSCDDEIESARQIIRTLGGRIDGVKSYSLPCGDRRTLVVIRKAAPTPKGYPRPQNKIIAAK